VILFAVGGVLLLAAGSWLAWVVTRPAPEIVDPIAQNPELPPRVVKPVPKERRTEDVKKPEPKPPVIQPAAIEKKEEPRPAIEPKKPVIQPIKTEEPKKPVIQPIKTEEPKKPVIQPIKPEEPKKPVVKPKKKDSPPVVVKKKPDDVIQPIKLVWKLKEGEEFFQELMVAQKPSFKVQGIPIAMVLQYQIISRFKVLKAGADGSLIVEQKIVGAKLMLADDLTRPTVAGAIARLPGTTYTLHLSARMDVTKFEGKVAGPNIGNMKFAGGMGVQMTSLIDRDGWKELAQSTFFQMGEPLKVGTRWAKPMTHNWGSLGSWRGKINYLYMGQQKDLHKVGYGLQLAYQAPRGGSVSLLKVNGANFQPQQAEGMLLFDAARGKVVAAEERFRVRGIVNASLLGSNTPIEIFEDQHFQIRIHDKLER
jgi:hypothetical protein